MEDDVVGPVPGFIKRGVPDHVGHTGPQEMEVSWEFAVSVWWLIIWRSVAGGLLIGALLGALIGIFGAMLGTPPIGGTWVSQILSITVGMAWMIVCVRWALQKRYAGFRIALLRE